MMLLTPRDLREIGEALYGPSWRGVLARKIARSQRMLLDYENGKPIPPEVGAILLDLCREQIAVITSRAKTLTSDFSEVKN